MTEPASGPSLLQARDGHSALQHRRHDHLLHHQHHHHARSHGHAALHRRQEVVVEEGPIVQIIHTVNIVQILDESGAIVEIHTSTSEPTTTTAFAAGGADDPAVTPPADGDQILTDAETILPTVGLGDEASDVLESLNPSPSPSMTSFPTVESFAPITPSAHLPTPSNLPSLNGGTNSTGLYTNGTASLRPFNNSSSTLPLTGTAYLNSSISTNLDSSTGTASLTTSYDPYETASATTTRLIFGGFGSGSGNGDGSAATLQPSSSVAAGGASGSSAKDPPAATVAGSVIGAVAGVALIVVAALFLLRWKKRQNALKLRDSDTGGRGLISGGAPFSGATRGVGDMAERRRSVPFAVPAALASLSGNKRQSRQNAPADGEKGFQKVAGRKLPSVLYHGGDGFSNPPLTRDSTMSDASLRDSVAIFEGRSVPRLAVGSPMRPESGIPIYHEGPARTPVTEKGRFSPVVPPPRSDSPTLAPPPPQRDPLGRSHPSFDGSNRSHGSGSRFSEHL